MRIRPKPVYSLTNQTETCIFIDMMIACVNFHWLDAGRVDYRPVTLHCRYKVQLSQSTCIIVVIYLLNDKVTTEHTIAHVLSLSLRLTRTT